jgi:hypothetical protein
MFKAKVTDFSTNRLPLFLEQCRGLSPYIVVVVTNNNNNNIYSVFIFLYIHGSYAYTKTLRVYLLCLENRLNRLHR